MYKLENAATKLADRLVDGIIRNGDKMPSWEMESLSEDAKKYAADFVAAIRETIVAEIEARK